MPSRPNSWDRQLQLRSHLCPSVRLGHAPRDQLHFTEFSGDRPRSLQREELMRAGSEERHVESKPVCWCHQICWSEIYLQRSRGRRYYKIYMLYVIIYILLLYTACCLSDLWKRKIAAKKIMIKAFNTACIFCGIIMTFLDVGKKSDQNWNHQRRRHLFNFTTITSYSDQL